MDDDAHLSISDVLSLLRAEFPEITISKIRFLESQGLIEPERTPSGYRRFYAPDVERLRWILQQQKDHYLPLKVIRDRLSHELDGDHDEPVDAGERGEAPQATDRRDHPSATPRLFLIEGSTPDPHSDDETGSVDREASTPHRPLHGSAGEREGAAMSIEPPMVVPTGAANEPLDPTPPAGSGSDTATGGDIRRFFAPTPAETRDRLARDEPATSASVDDGGDDDGRGDDGGGDDGGVNAGREPRSAVEDPGDAPGRGRSGARGTSSSRRARSRDRSQDELDDGGWTRKPGSGAEAVQFTRAELAQTTELSEQEVIELESFGLLPRPRHTADATLFDDEALAVAHLAKRFAAHGIEPRHLRMYKQFAEREAALIEQVVAPIAKRTRDGRRQAQEQVAELERLGRAMRVAMLRAAFRGSFNDS